MTTQALIKYTTIEETLELQFEDTNTYTYLDIKPQLPHEEPIISLHALSSISTSQTLKLTGYNKHQELIVLLVVEVLTISFIREWQKKPIFLYT